MFDLETLSNQITFPVPVSMLTECLPHRGTAIWVSEVLWVDESEGEFAIELRPEANYCDENFVRPTSYLEWLAQGYGYVSACQALSQANAAGARAQKAYLVGMRDVFFSPDPFCVIRGEKATGWVKRTHEMGPIQLIEGRIFSPTKQILATAKLKVYAQ